MLDTSIPASYLTYFIIWGHFTSYKINEAVVSILNISVRVNGRGRLRCRSMEEVLWIISPEAWPVGSMLRRRSSRDVAATLWASEALVSHATIPLHIFQPCLCSKNSLRLNLSTETHTYNYSVLIKQNRRGSYSIIYESFTMLTWNLCLQIFTESLADFT